MPTLLGQDTGCPAQPCLVEAGEQREGSRFPTLEPRTTGQEQARPAQRTHFTDGQSEDWDALPRHTVTRRLEVWDLCLPPLCRGLCPVQWLPAPFLNILAF